MNKTECENCKRVMEEGIRNANQAMKEFTEANETDSRVHFEILRMKAENHRGYAEGILQALVCIGFKHDRMRELEDLLGI
jgi:hypothetical protein